jgi:hypothetical protein
VSRLLVADATEIRVLDARNGRGVTLPPHPVRSLANRQPVWSPDGTRVAWSAFDRRQADSPTYLAIARADGSARLDHPLVFPAFYLHWRPDGRAVAALGEGPLGLELTVIDADTGDARILTRGTPLFFDWSVDGAICANVGTGREQRIELLDDRAGPDPMQSLTPVPFTAPAWCGAHEMLVALQSESHRLLALVDRSATIRRPIATLGGFARFTASRDGRQIAWVSGRLPNLTDMVAGLAEPRPGIPAGRPDELYVHDLVDDTRRVVADTAPALFCWSPDGRALLFASMQERGELPLLRWHVWRDGDVQTYATFRPSTMVAREYLPFAEQYARSLSWWSPDGRAFCYAGIDVHGNEGVWVQHLDGRLERVGTGQFVTWSPSASK